MSAKHTPGPWRKQYEFGFYNIEADAHDEPGKTHLVAAAVSERDVPILLAAPELLAELKKFTRAMAACMDWPDTTSSMVKLAKIAESARTIIAKVEGQ